MSHQHDFAHHRYLDHRRVEELRCRKCPARTRRDTERCACWIQRPRVLMHPIYKTAVLVRQFAVADDCEACGGSGWVPAPPGPPACCCVSGWPRSEWCGGCRLAHGAGDTHFCAVPEATLALGDSPGRSRASEAARRRAAALE